MDKEIRDRGRRQQEIGWDNQRYTGGKVGSKLTAPVPIGRESSGASPKTRLSAEYAVNSCFFVAFLRVRFTTSDLLYRSFRCMAAGSPGGVLSR